MIIRELFLKIMASSRRNRTNLHNILEDLENDSSLEIGDRNGDLVFVPDANVNDSVETEDATAVASGDSDESDDDGYIDIDQIEGGSYEYVSDKYDDSQKLLEPDHVYDWVSGEHNIQSIDIQEDIFLSPNQKQEILGMRPVQLFEKFFSQDLKSHIIDCTLENGYALAPKNFNKFLGILIASVINSRKRERDFWSKNKLLRHEVIASALSRDDYLKIKKFLKFSKKSDKDLKNKVWRVDKMGQIFRKNLQRYGFFSSKCSIDETMVKFYGRLKFKQYIRNKPVRFGLKLWSIASSSGFLFDFYIYCGKEDGKSDQKLGNCPLGSRVVMKLLHKLLKKFSKEQLEKYHITFDNFFTSPDLLLHLAKLGLKATGTVRQNRVYNVNIEQGKKTGKKQQKKVTVPVSLTNKSSRGEYECKYDSQSKMHYISVKDSKVVSVLSTAAGVSPTVNLDRQSGTGEGKKSIAFPRAFKIYNKTMGGVDLYDQHCSDVKINIQSKRWTWTVFLRLIETAISNATVLYNLCTEGKKKSTYDFVKEIAGHYLAVNAQNEYERHELIQLAEMRRVCSACSKKVDTYCFQCKQFICRGCYNESHGWNHEGEVKPNKRKCTNDSCAVRTKKFCTECSKYMCVTCFEGNFHKKLATNLEP